MRPLPSRSGFGRSDRGLQPVRRGSTCGLLSNARQYSADPSSALRRSGLSAAANCAGDQRFRRRSRSGSSAARARSIPYQALPDSSQPIARNRKNWPSRRSSWRWRAFRFSACSPDWWRSFSAASRSEASIRPGSAAPDSPVTGILLGLVDMVGWCIFLAMMFSHGGGRRQYAANSSRTRPSWKIWRRTSAPDVRQRAHPIQLAGRIRRQGHRLGRDSANSRRDRP